jgi:hypothetical protein
MLTVLRIRTSLCYKYFLMLCVGIRQAGSVTVESAVGQVTTFSLHLPRVVEPQEVG